MIFTPTFEFLKFREKKKRNPQCGVVFLFNPEFKCVLKRGISFYFFFPSALICLHFSLVSSADKALQSCSVSRDAQSSEEMQVSAPNLCLILMSSRAAQTFVLEVGEHLVLKGAAKKQLKALTSQ